jgi:plastocyanin
MRAIATIAGTLASTGLVFLGFFALAPTVVAGDPCYHGYQVPPLDEGSTTEIKVAPCAFGPTVAHVAVGSTVTFFNGPTFTHLITGANAEWGSKDVELKPAEQVSYTFTKPGIYPYACALHRGMSGAIVVGDVAATTANKGESDAAVEATTTATSPPSAGGAGGAQVAAAGGLGVLVGGLAVIGLARLRRTPTAG